MTLELKPSNKTARLPSTACEEEFFAEVQGFAKEHRVSVAALVRASLRFFLDANVGKSEQDFGKRRRSKKAKKAKDQPAQAS